MKKTVLKILATIVAIIVVCIALFYIRQYYNIDPRIWFFVVFGVYIAGLCAIYCLFDSKIQKATEYFNTHSFFEFILAIESKESKRPKTKFEKKIKTKLKAIQKRLQKVKSVIEEIDSNPFYSCLSSTIVILAFAGLMYESFFYEDFVSRTMIYVIFLIMIAYTSIKLLLKAIAKNSIFWLLIAVGWGYIFLTDFMKFVL